jgi:hypothetical protein
MELLHQIERSGHLYPYYDYAHGYGIPQAGYFFNNRPSIDTTFAFNVKMDTLFVEVIDIEDSFKPNLLYYHIEDPAGFLNYYAVIDVENQIPLKVPLSNLRPGEILRFHYKGYNRNFRKND